MRHYVTYGGGAQTLYHLPMDHEARASRVSSATYQIVDLRESEDSSARTVQASGSATVDAANRTLVAAAGPTQANPNLIQLDAVTGLTEGHQYLLEGASSGLTELIVIERIDTSNMYAYTRNAIRNVFASSDTLRGVEVQGAFPSGEAADEDKLQNGGGPYGVIWSYTIDGRPYSPIDDIYVRRNTTQPLCTESDVLQSYPRLEDRARNQIKIADAIATASRHARSELENASIKPELLVGSESLTMAVTYRAIAVALRWLRTDGDSDADDIEHYEGLYRSLMRTILNGQPPERVTSMNNVSASAQPGGEKTSFDELIRPS
jgi:hypothetical protein